MHEDTARVEHRLEMEIRLGREGGLMGAGLKGAGYKMPFLKESLAEKGLDATLNVRFDMKKPQLFILHCPYMPCTLI